MPAPTSTASDWARIRCTSARARGPVIQRLSPVPVAIRPSSEAASFSVSIGRPVVSRLRKPRLSATASVGEAADLDRDPGRAQRLDARGRSTRGSGSSIATTTRATPAAISASVQGGVAPVWAQGSSVT